MNCQETNTKQFDEASMMDLDTSSSGDYPWEVFATGDKGDYLGYHDVNPINDQGPLALAAGNGNPQVGTPPLVHNGVPIIQSPDQQ